MGLIRSGNTNLTPLDDDKLTAYLWPIVKEMIKTAIENNQNLIVEGCYIPFTWNEDFDENYLKHIKYCCLIMTEKYIRNHFDDILKYSNVVEKRLDDLDLSIDELIKDNNKALEEVLRYKLNYVLIDDTYRIKIDL